MSRLEYLMCSDDACFSDVAFCSFVDKNWMAGILPPQSFSLPTSHSDSSCPVLLHLNLPQRPGMDLRYLMQPVS